MVSSRFVSALAAAAIMATASAQNERSSSIVSIPTPTVTKPASAMKTIGCFSDPEPLEDHGFYIFQSAGNCQLICLMLDKPVLGLAEGTDCWCGEELPRKNAKVDDALCDTPCKGDNTTDCGGPKKYWIQLTGLTDNRIENFDPSTLSSTITESSSSQPTSVVSKASATATATSSGPQESKSPSKVGIAVGAVVGVVGLAAIIGGVFFFLRNKRRREVEEEYRRQAAVNSFASGGKLHTSNSSMTDSRLDPEFMNRRQSNGSIADNEDYSRRILKVTNA